MKRSVEDIEAIFRSAEAGDLEPLTRLVNEISLRFRLRFRFADAACHCPCHEAPGVYPTSRERPCGACGHVDADGELRAFRRGWLPRAG